MDSKTDGDRLSELLGDKNRAEFARHYRIRGGGSLISQHVSGHRPISLESALAYSKAFGVPLDAVSPTVAQLVRDAAKSLSVAPTIAPVSPPTLAEALEVLGTELARDLPDDVREDVAELLAKLARRRGAQRHQSELLTLLAAPPEKQQRCGMSMGQVYTLPRPRGAPHLSGIAGTPQAGSTKRGIRPAVAGPLWGVQCIHGRWGLFGTGNMPSGNAIP